MDGVDVPNLITTGVVTASAFTSSTDTTVAAIMNASAQNASLLSGLNTATNLRSVSTTSYDGTRFHTRAGESRFGGLVVDGTPVSTHPAANTVIMLPDVGRVVVNDRAGHHHRCER